MMCDLFVGCLHAVYYQKIQLVIVYYLRKENTNAQAFFAKDLMTLESFPGNSNTKKKLQDYL